jgi:hypothetical protein
MNYIITYKNIINRKTKIYKTDFGKMNFGHSWGMSIFDFPKKVLENFAKIDCDGDRHKK